MSERAPVRAGILVTGTEVLTGIISDRNGPWLSERLREVGVDAAMIHVVGDRPEDLLASLEYMRREGMAVVITSGGLGPTADDLTAEIVGRFCGREMVLDDELEAKIAEILRPLLRRWPGLDQDALRESNRKQAVIPKGATILDPVGTARGSSSRRCSPAVVRRSWCCRVRRASFSRCGARRSRPTRSARRSRARPRMSTGAAAVRDPRVRDREHAAGGRDRGPRARAARDHDARESPVSGLGCKRVHGGGRPSTGKEAPHALSLSRSCSYGGPGRRGRCRRRHDGSARPGGDRIGPGFTISLKNAGKNVATLKHGKYVFMVRDKSNIHNFTVNGPGIKNKTITATGFVGMKTATLTLAKGGYRFYCTVHPSVSGTFKVT